MAKSKLKLLATVALCVAAVGCTTQTTRGPVNVGSTEPLPAKSADVEPTLRQAALLAEHNGNYAEAAQHYTALRSKHPQDTALMLSQARNLRFSGNPQAAIGVLNSAGASNSTDAIMLLELGKAYLAADQLNLAKPTLERAKTSAPLNWEILSALGVVYDYEGKYQLAQEQYEAALFLTPDNPTILNNKALSLAQEGKLDEAMAVMQIATNQPAAGPQTRQNMALLMALKGDTEGAERLARKDLPPTMAEANITYYRSLATPQ
jgi:Flp pilus assembly protein TadD